MNLAPSWCIVCPCTLEKRLKKSYRDGEISCLQHRTNSRVNFSCGPFQTTRHFQHNFTANLSSSRQECMQARTKKGKSLCNPWENSTSLYLIWVGRDYSQKYKPLLIPTCRKVNFRITGSQFTWKAWKTRSSTLSLTSLNQGPRINVRLSCRTSGVPAAALMPRQPHSGNGLRRTCWNWIHPGLTRQTMKKILPGPGRHGMACANTQPGVCTLTLPAWVKMVSILSVIPMVPTTTG